MLLFGIGVFIFCAVIGFRWFFSGRKKIRNIDDKHRSVKARIGDWGDDWSDKY
jgi:TM2 domain-containing membrane protein YozV